MSGLTAAVAMWAVLGSGPAAPRHGFVAGSEHGFALELSQTSRSVPADAAGEQRFEVRAQLRIRVDRVDAEGRASGRLDVESFGVTGEGGLPLARLRAVEAGALSVPLTVEADGAIRLQQTLALLLDGARGHRLLRVALDAQGLVAPLGMRGLRAQQLMTFESRSGRPVGAPAAAVMGRGESVLSREDTAIWLLPTEGLAMVLLPAARGVEVSEERTRGAWTLRMSAAAAPRGRTKVTASARPRLDPTGATVRPPVSMRRDGGVARPAPRPRASRQLTAELTLVLRTRTAALLQLTGAVERGDALDLHATRSQRVEFTLRRLQ